VEGVIHGGLAKHTCIRKCLGKHPKLLNGPPPTTFLNYIRGGMQRVTFRKSGGADYLDPHIIEPDVSADFVFVWVPAHARRNVIEFCVETVPCLSSHVSPLPVNGSLAPTFLARPTRDVLNLEGMCKVAGGGGCVHTVSEDHQS
jgi:hypothetical protein